MKKKTATAAFNSPVTTFTEAIIDSSTITPAGMRLMNSASVKMNILPSGMVIIASTVSGHQGLTTAMAISIYLQRNINGEWQNVPGAYWSETIDHCCHSGFEVAYQATRGCLYRGYSFITAYCNDDCEARPLASNVMLY